MKKLFINNKSFRLFWIASSISTLGDFVDDIAFAQLVYFVTQSTLLTSYVFSIKVVFSFLSTFSATYVDKHDKKKILVFTSVGQGIVLLLLLVLFYKNLLNAHILIAFVTVQTLFSTFSGSAHNAILSCIVTKEDMVSARSSLNIFMRFIEIFSYIFAGALITLIGIGGAILLDSTTFFVSAVIMIYIDNKEESNQKFDSVKSFFRDVREGFHFVINQKNIYSILIVTFLGNMLTSPIDGLMPAYFAQGEYKSYTYASFMIGIAVGGIAGTWLLTKLQKKLDNEKLLAFGFLLGAIGLGILYINNIVAVYFSSIFIGGSFGFVSVLNATILQIATPNGMIARVFSIFKCISFIASPIGIIVAGFMGEFLDMTIVFVILAILMMVTAIMTLRIVKDSNKNMSFQSMKEQ